MEAHIDHFTEAGEERLREKRGLVIVFAAETTGLVMKAHILKIMRRIELHDRAYRLMISPLSRFRRPGPTDGSAVHGS